MIKFDCYKKEYKSVFGAIRCEERVSFCVHVKDVLEIEHVNLVSRSENGTDTAVLKKVSKKNDYDIFRGDAVFTGSGFHFYRFELVKADKTMYFVGTSDGHTAVIGDWLPEWRLFVYDKGFETPKETRGAVMYQIFPDRFFKSEHAHLHQAKNERIIHSDWCEKPHCFYDYPGFKCNDYFCGNLKGIEEKLPYIKALGVTHLYLNPIFESAENHRYSTSDYMNIDPFLGNSADFKALCDKAREYDIKIILDGVFSHTGDDSIYFNKYGHYDSVGAYNSTSSPFFEWYSFKEYPDSYDCWWGFKTLPNVNETNAGYTEYITGKNGVLRHWLKMGASGWRLDVADELPDEFLDAVRSAVKEEDPQALIIGEVWENAVTKHSYGKQRRFLSGRQCDTVMNYPFSDAICRFLKTGDAEAFYRTVMEILNDYPPPSVNCLMNMLSTHDTARIINRLALDSMPERCKQSQATLSESERERGIELMKAAVILQFTLPGIPCIYYGDEAGLDGFEDPFCRATYPWGKEEKSLLNLHKTLGIIRSKYKHDFSCGIDFIKHSDGVVCYRRNAITVAVNMSSTLISVSDAVPEVSHKFSNGRIESGGAAIFRSDNDGKNTFDL